MSIVTEIEGVGSRSSRLVDTVNYSMGSFVKLADTLITVLEEVFKFADIVNHSTPALNFQEVANACRKLQHSELCQECRPCQLQRSQPPALCKQYDPQSLPILSLTANMTMT